MRAETRWATADAGDRAELAREAGLPPRLAAIVSRIRSLNRLAQSSQAAIRESYADRLLRADVPAERFDLATSDRIDGPYDRAAAEMFALAPLPDAAATGSGGPDRVQRDRAHRVDPGRQPPER